MNTKKFHLHHHDTSKNYRVLVDGQVHPLLCGLTDIDHAVSATRSLFPDFDGLFDNHFTGPRYYSSSGLSAKVNIIAELERLLAIVKGVSPEEIEDFEMEVTIDFYRPGTAVELPPEMKEIVDECRARTVNSAAADLLSVSNLLAHHTGQSWLGAINKERKMDTRSGDFFDISALDSIEVPIPNQQQSFWSKFVKDPNSFNGFKVGELLTLGVLRPSIEHKSNISGWLQYEYGMKLGIVHAVNPGVTEDGVLTHTPLEMSAHQVSDGQSPNIPTLWVANIRENWDLINRDDAPVMGVDRETMAGVELYFDTTQAREQAIEYFKQSPQGVIDKPNGVDDE